MEKQIVIKPEEIEKSIKTVGKTFNHMAFKVLMEKFEVKIDEMMEVSKAHRVAGKDSEVRSIEIATAAKALDKVIDKARMTAKRPYLDFNQALDGMVRPLQKSLKSIEKDERSKCVKYRNKVLAQERAAEADKPKKVELGGVSLNIGGSKPVPKAEGKVETHTAGSGSYDKVLVHELVDITKVPAKYLLLNDKAIKAAIKAGITQIPGLNIKEEMKMTLRS